MPRIEFHTLRPGLAKIPHPYPASRHIPDWLNDNFWQRVTFA
jgi:hypothetical protein